MLTGRANRFLTDDDVYRVNPEGATRATTDGTHRPLSVSDPGPVREPLRGKAIGRADLDDRRATSHKRLAYFLVIS